MIDRRAVARYDAFWQAPNPAAHRVRRRRRGLLKSATVVEPSGHSAELAASFDVVVAGAGPAGTLHAALLARRGHSVLLLEKSSDHRSGSTWNISRSEFEALKATELFEPGQCEELRLGESDQGVFRLWDDGISGQREFRFDGVLTVSLDERRYFELLGKVPGLTVELGCRAELFCVTPEAVVVRAQHNGHEELIRARLLIDARGWRSPLAALVNRGRSEESWYNMIGLRCRVALPRRRSLDPPPPGLICCTLQDENRRPAEPVLPIWGRFADALPGGEHTGDLIYYYTRTPKPVPLAPMFDLLLDQVEQVLPGFEEEMVYRTYYGHAAGYHQPSILSRRIHQVSAGDRILLVGVAAQQYSGLTGCAVGALVRNASRISRKLDRALAGDRLRFEVLQGIDIDRRERATQELTGLFAGAMRRAPVDSPITMSRDWLTFASALDQLDPLARSLLLCDDLSFATFNRMLLRALGSRELIEAFARTNRGKMRHALSTVAGSYLTIAACDLGRAWKQLRRWVLEGLSGGAASPEASSLHDPFVGRQLSLDE